MAINAGVHGLGVTYGAHTLKELEGCSPQAVLGSVPLVREWLLDRARRRLSAGRRSPATFLQSESRDPAEPCHRAPERLAPDPVYPPGVTRQAGAG